MIALIGPPSSSLLSHVVTDLVIQLLDAEHVTVIGPTSADLSPMGGPRIKSYRSASEQLRDRPVRVVNVAGMATAWAILDHLETMLNLEDRRILRELRTIDPQLARTAATMITGSGSPLAFVPDANELFTVAEIAYHSVDLVALEALPASSQRLLIDRFRHADHVGIRNRSGFEWAIDNGLDVAMEPSPLAALTSDIALTHSSRASSDTGNDGSYVVVQADRFAGHNADLTALVRQLRHLTMTTGLRIVIIPGDVAPDSRTRSTYHRIASEVGRAAEVVEVTSLWDVVLLIQRSAGYLGDSVQGRIVAGSLNVPRRSIATKATVRRLIEHCETWDPVAGGVITDVQTLAEAGIAMLNDDATTRATQNHSTAVALAACWPQHLRPSPTENRPALPNSVKRDTFGEVNGPLDQLLRTARQSAQRGHVMLHTLSDPDTRAHVDDATIAGLFDADWYATANPDLDIDIESAFEHYRSKGWREGRSPHPCFDPLFYADQSPDLDGVDPLEHYLLFGWKEGRDPSQWFSVSHYLSKNEDVLDAGREPLQHYLKSGWMENRDPSAQFDTTWYRRAFPPVDQRPPLIDHIITGQHEGRPTKCILTPTVLESRRRRPVTHGAAVVAHLHYLSVWPDIFEVIQRAGPAARAYITVTADAGPTAIETIERDAPNATVVTVENRGRDVLPFITMLPRLLDDGVDVALKIHGKRSKLLSHGETWRRQLLHAVCPSESAFGAVASLFASNPEIGIAMPTDFTQPLTLHLRDNLVRLRQACDDLRLSTDVDQPSVVRSTPFSRGNMYWFRPTSLRRLVELGEDRFEPESGQNDGTFAHAIERIPALIADEDGYETIAFEFAE